MAEPQSALSLYPMFVKLAGRRCLIAGGGAVAQRKAEGLLDAGAEVTVVSPELTGALGQLHRQGRISWRQRAFVPADLAGAFLAVAATDDPAKNAAIAAGCREAGILVNVADEPELCDFLVPSVARRGRLAIAVSTGGASPLLARQVRAKLEESLAGPWGEYAELLARQREMLRKSVPDRARRDAILRTILESDIFELLSAGRHEEAQQRAHEICTSSQQG